MKGEILFIGGYLKRRMMTFFIGKYDCDDVVTTYLVTYSSAKKILKTFSNFCGLEGIALVVFHCIPSLLVRPAFLLIFWFFLRKSESI